MRDPIEYIAGWLARRSVQWNPEITLHPEDIRFHLALKINYYLVIFAALAIGIITHYFFETAACLLAFGILRRYTGGFHIPTLTGCAVVTIALMVYIPYVNLWIAVPAWINIFSLAIVYYLTDKPDKKWLSIGFILLGLAINQPEVTLSFLAQSVTLIKLRR